MDADVGQSHIGPPTTVGWARVHPGQSDLSKLEPEGLVFVGDVTPVGHLLHLTTAIALCTQAALRAAEIILIDTPGYVADSAACALWWNVERLLQPSRIIALRRANELDSLLTGLQNTLLIDVIATPETIPSKSPEMRRRYRQRLFEQYFRDARTHEIHLDTVAVRAAGPVTSHDLTGHLVGLGSDHAMDLAIGIIESWHPEKHVVSIRSSISDPRTIHCITIGSPYFIKKAERRIDVP